MTIRVFLVDDHELMRSGIAALLRKEPDVEIVGEAVSGLDALRSVEKASPDVVLMDVVMRELNGMETTRQLLASNPGIRVVALSGYADRRYVSRMLSSGASGYVLKANAYDELVEAIKAVASGKSYVCREVTQTVVVGGSDPQVDASVHKLLGPRERAVLQLIAEGFSSISIAEKFALSPATVETHRRNLMRKLDLHSVADLTRYAIREGLTSADS